MNQQIKSVIMIILVMTQPAFSNNLCHQSSIAISQIQGIGQSSPMVGQSVTTQGVVTGVFQGSDQLDGFYVQSLRPDDNQSTSEGLFIHHSKTAVSLGDHLVINGEVSERHDMTQLIKVRVEEICQRNVKLPAPVYLELPFKTQDLEYLEGMYVHLPQTLTVSDIGLFDRYGLYTLSDGMLFSATQIVLPGLAAKKKLKENSLNQLLVDDGRNGQYLAQRLRLQAEGEQTFSARHPVRTGYQVNNVTGILAYDYGQYKVQPTETVVFNERANSRKNTPDDVGGDIQLASFNMENFFTTIDDGKDHCGPERNWGCRGADSSEEWQRQLAKTVSVIQQSGAELVALQELENNDQLSISALVDALNQSGEQRWTFVDTGHLANDAIKVAMIYQHAAVKPIGNYVILDDHSMKGFKIHRHRPVVMQAFETTQGQRFQLASIHLKSKSCRDAEEQNKAQGDGQGCYAGERAIAAKQLLQWLEKDPVSLNIKATFLAGDFNSYGREDTLRVLESGGFINAVRHFHGDHNWTTSYRGQLGALDHIMVSEAASDWLTGATQWHINSNEYRGFGYHTEDLSDDTKKPAAYYEINPFSSSDHDLVVIGIGQSK